MNMAGNLGSFLTSLAFPYLQLLTGSTSSFFVVGASLNAIAVILWSRTRPLAPAGDPDVTLQARGIS
jgi:ACS family glucarate transporter-like MFS transporter